MKKVPSSGFFSYRQLDNNNDKNYLSHLRQHLEQEIGTLIGRSISIWQDVENIEWGQHWKKEITKGLAEAAFFIPVITPGYLRSEGCRDEFNAFLTYEKGRARNDLILPLMYVRPDEFDDPKSKDEIVKVVLERQYVDWEPLRHIGDERIEYRQKLTILGKRIRVLMRFIGTDPVSKKAKKTLKKRTDKSRTSSSKLELPSPADSATLTVTQRRTLLVNLMGGTGIYQSIGAALAVAQGGDLIILAPGHYRETIILDKPVEMIGEGNRGDVTVEVKENSVLVSTATFGRMKNLTLRQDGGDFLAVNVKAGSIELEGCEITSAGLSCVGIQPKADARIRNCKLHGSPQAGVAFFSNARGIVEQCEIYKNGFSGIHVYNCQDVTIRGNALHDGAQSGLLFTKNAEGLAEDNEVFANKKSGIIILDGANPTIRLNRVYDGKDTGISVRESGRGILTENEIFRNTFSGLQVSNSNPIISKNDIHDGHHNGIYFLDGAKGLVENNRITGNKFNGINIIGSSIEARANKISKNGSFGIKVDEKSDGTFEDNVLSENTKGAKEIHPNAQNKVKWGKNTES